MNSCIYAGRMGHYRSTPSPHRFSYRMFMLYLDLDEIDSVFSNRLFWSVNRLNLACFLETDHYIEEGFGLADSIRRLVERETSKSVKGPIRLLTHLRYFGFIMNPVSFFYCHDETDSHIEFIVAEIHNTPWGERHCYVLDCNGQHDVDKKTFTFSKMFHVSPFMSMQQEYHWTLSQPHAALSVHMRNYEYGKKIFSAYCHLHRNSVSPANLAMMLIKYPFMTLRVFIGIYWQALCLWLKKVPFHEHPKHYMKQSTKT